MQNKRKLTSQEGINPVFDGQRYGTGRKLAFFDLETTGIGSYSSQGQYIPPNVRPDVWLNKQLQLDVGIYSVGWATPKGKVQGLWGRVDGIPVEEGAMPIFNLNKEYIEKSNMTEERMLRKFATSLKNKGVDTLAGYNIGDYDVPLLVKRMKQLGLDEEARFVEGMKFADVKNIADDFIDQVSAPYAEALGREPGSKLGTKLEDLAAGFGIGDGKHHLAPDDVRMTQELLEKLQDPEMRRDFNIMAWWESVEARQQQRAADGAIRWESKTSALKAMVEAGTMAGPTHVGTLEAKTVASLKDQIYAAEQTANKAPELGKIHAIRNKGIRGALSSPEMLKAQNEVLDFVTTPGFKTFAGVMGGILAVSYLREPLQDIQAKLNGENRSGVRDQGSRSPIGTQTYSYGNYTVNPGSRYLGG